MITTDIDRWLDELSLENHYEIYDLYTTVSSEMNMNLFHISINENYPRRLFIIPVAQNMDTLMLTDNSKPVFIRKFQIIKHIVGDDVVGDPFSHFTLRVNDPVRSDFG